MNTTLLIILCSSTILALTLITTMLINKKSKTTNEDWAIGGRSLPLYVVVGTQFASAMGGGILVAHIGVAYKGGLSVITYNVGIFIALNILIFIAKWIRHNNFTTIPDILQRFYGKHKGIALVSALLTIIVPFGWITSQLVAFGKIYEPITGISPTVLIFVLACVSMAFVIPSGLKTVAWTDFFFACFMIAVAGIISKYALNLGGGLSTIMAKNPVENVAFPQGLISVGPYTALLWIFACLPGALTNQIYYQRICATKNVKDVNKSLTISSVIIFIGAFWSFFMGTSIRAANPNLAPEMATGWFLTQIPTWLLVLFAGVVVATLLSTISSATQTVVVNITEDIYKKIINPNVTSEELLKKSRIMSIAILMIAAVMSVYFRSVLGWFVMTYAFSAAGLLVPIFVGYIFRNKNFITPSAAMWSMILGIAGCVIGKSMETSIPYVFWGIFTSLATIIIVSLFTKSNANVDKDNGTAETV